jgi:hypothetical protein
MRSNKPAVVIPDDAFFAAHAEAIADTVDTLVGRAAPELAAVLGGEGSVLAPPFFLRAADEEEATRLRSATSAATTATEGVAGSCESDSPATPVAPNEEGNAEGSSKADGGGGSIVIAATMCRVSEIRDEAAGDSSWS